MKDFCERLPSRKREALAAFCLRAVDSLDHLPVRATTIASARDYFPEAPSRDRIRRGDFCSALKGAPFRYWRDPACIVSCIAYAVNRWLLLPRFAMGPFMRGHFADTLLIPAALPLVLWLQRRLGLRTHDGMPGGGEILLHLAIWAFIAEGAGPFLTHHGTADWRDVVAYSAGAAVCYVLWHWRKIPCRAT